RVSAMTRKQLGALAAANAGTYIIGNSLLPLLPLHFEILGATVGNIGLYFSLIFAALMVGSLAGGWLSARYERRKQVIGAAAPVSMAALLVMGQTSNLTLPVLLTMLLWFVGGLVTTSVNILAGLHAGPHERGRVFGTIGVTVGLTQLLGAAIAGMVVARWGYSALFPVVAATQLVPFAAALLIDDSVKTP